MQSKNHKETQQTKNMKQTKKNDAKISYMFFSVKNSRCAPVEEIWGVASKMARKKHEKTAEKKADNSVRKHG